MHPDDIRVLILLCAFGRPVTVDEICEAANKHRDPSKFSNGVSFSKPPVVPESDEE